MKQEINFSMTVPGGGHYLKIQAVYQADTSLIVMIETEYSDGAAHCAITKASVKPMTVELADVSHPHTITYFVIDSEAPRGAWWLTDEKFTHVQSRAEINIPEYAICILDKINAPIPQPIGRSLHEVTNPNSLTRLFGGTAETHPVVGVKSDWLHTPGFTPPVEPMVKNLVEACPSGERGMTG